MPGQSPGTTSGLSPYSLSRDVVEDDEDAAEDDEDKEAMF